MSIRSYLEKKLTVQNVIITFIENSDNTEENYENFIKVINDQKIKEDPYELKSLLHLILKISKHHYRTSDFFNKIEKILQNFTNEINKYFSNCEKFNIFKGNKRILLYLIKNGLITIDKSIVQIITNEKYSKASYPQYFYPEINNFICNDKFKQEITDDFEEKRSQGENENPICELIRKDSIEQFITYVNSKSLSVQSTVEPSIFETHPLLIREIESQRQHNFPYYMFQNQNQNSQIKLIEYAAFFGSFQIFQYLFKNKAEVSESIWTFAIHGQNPELMNFLETNGLKPNPDSYKKYFYESIKCFHNDVSNYLQSNYLQTYEHTSEVIKYYNFAYIRSDTIDKNIFFDLCKYDFAYLVKEILENSNLDINHKSISTFNCFYSISNCIFLI